MLPMRWKCGCSFDGTDYSGWQTQDGPLSIQQVVEECLSEIFKKETKAIGSGRTDAGVHAMEQVFHFDFEWKHDPGSFNPALCNLRLSILRSKKKSAGVQSPDRSVCI